METKRTVLTKSEKRELTEIRNIRFDYHQRQLRIENEPLAEICTFKNAVGSVSDSIQTFKENIFLITKALKDATRDCPDKSVINKSFDVVEAMMRLISVENEIDMLSSYFYSKENKFSDISPDAFDDINIIENDIKLQN